MEFLDLLGPILTTLVGGGVFWFWIQRRKERRSDFKIVIDTYANENERLRDKIRDALEHINALSSEMRAMDKSVTHLQHKLFS